MKYWIFAAVALLSSCGDNAEIPDSYNTLMQSITTDLKKMDIQKSIFIKEGFIESERALPDTLEHKILQLASFSIKGIEKRNEHIIFVTEGWKGTYIGFCYTNFPPDFAISYQTIDNNNCYKVTFK